MLSTTINLETDQMIKCIVCKKMHSMDEGLMCAECKQRGLLCSCLDPVHPGDNPKCPIHGKAV